MRSQNAVIIVRFVAEGFHRWPDAPPHRAYLRDKHRHLFHVEASMVVKHDDREVEFHDLLDACKTEFGSGDFEGQSCEMLARKLATWANAKYGREVAVRVFEDNEVGALAWAP